MVNSLELEIMMFAVCLLITVAIVTPLIERFYIFEKIAELKEDIVNIYTPDVLKPRNDNSKDEKEKEVAL